MSNGGRPKARGWIRLAEAESAKQGIDAAKPLELNSQIYILPFMGYNREKNHLFGGMNEAFI